MRIGINLMFVSKGLAGGRVYADGLLRAFNELHGPEEYVLFTRQDAELPTLAPERFTVYRAGVPGASTIRRTLWEYLLLPRVARRFGLDVFHGFGGVSPRVKKCALVLTIHDLIYHQSPASVPLGPRLFMGWMLPRMARRADRIIAISQATAGVVMATLRVPEEKIRVVYNGPGHTFEAAPDSGVFAALQAQFDLRPPYVFSVGRAYPHKNLQGLARAFAHLVHDLKVPAQWVHAGELLTLGGDLDRLTRELNIASHVRFVGFLDNPALGALYRAASVFAFPSLIEGFGLPVLEALACGTPVVAANATSLPEVVGPAGLLADPNDPVALAQAIGRVLQEPGLRDSLRDKGGPQLAKFSWRKCAEETLRVYHEVAR